MVYSGKIYETDGAEAVAVHEADEVRPLSPIPHAPSLRIFHSGYQADEEPRYFYGNPGILAGASQILALPDYVVDLGVLPMVAAVLVSDAHRIEVEEADDLILGYTMVSLLVSRTDERTERQSGVLGRTYDLGGVIGPVITTPDELDDDVETAEFGRRHSLTAVLRINGVERERGSTLDLPFTFAQAISTISQTSILRTGDIIALGPVVEPGEYPTLLEPGDDVQLAVEKLGALSLKLTNAQ